MSLFGGSQHMRGPAPDGKAAAVAGSSIVVFLACLMLGLYLSNLGDTSRNPATQTAPMTLAPANQGTATTQTTIPQAPPVTNWRLVKAASTDFVGSRVDRTVWDVYDGAGNGGVGFRRPSALSVSNGQLRIKGQGDVSGGLSQKFSQVYGRWVVRARIEAGNGYGPALLLWPDSEKWPDDGEVDFFEVPKGDRQQALLTGHWGANNSQKSRGVPGDFTQWHTFTIDWLPDRLVFYVDDVEKFRLTEPEQIPRTPMHLAVQNDVGACNDGWIGCRDASTPSSVSMYVSNVRVYSPGS